MNLRNFAKLSRIAHAVMLSFSVIIAILLAGASPNSWPLYALSLLPPFLIGAASFILNDYFDADADRSNKRFERPLVNGSVSLHEAVFLSHLLLILGVAIAFPLGPVPFFIAALFAVLAVLYSYTLKDVALLGNSIIASSMSISFIYGNFVVKPVLDPAILFIALLAFSVGLAREISKTVQDHKGDKKARKSRTLPLLIGVKNSLRVSFFLYVFSILLSVIPFFMFLPFRFNLVYLALVLVADLFFVKSAIAPLQVYSPKSMEYSRKASLNGLGLSLLAFLLSALFSIPIFQP